MKNEVILSCPFCGNANVEVARTNPHACWIVCDEETGCGAEGQTAKTRRRAIANWNQRHALTVQATVTWDQDAEHKARKLAAKR